MSVAFENRAPGTALEPKTLYRVTLESSVACPASPFDIDGTLDCGATTGAHERAVATLAPIGVPSDEGRLFGQNVVQKLAAREGKAQFLGFFGGNVIRSVVVGKPKSRVTTRALIDRVSFAARGHIDTMVLEQIGSDDVGGVAEVALKTVESVEEIGEGIVNAARSLPSFRTVVLTFAAGVGAIVAIRVLT